jgi:hypothetical protein
VKRKKKEHRYAPCRQPANNSDNVFIHEHQCMTSELGAALSIGKFDMESQLEAAKEKIRFIETALSLTLSKERALRNELTKIE